MGYFNEFPHTKGYDGDLGYLIKMYKKLVALYQSNSDYLEELKGTITDITNEQLQKWLEDGTLQGLVDESLNIFINVKNHGAKGDGITDDTTAIQNCITNYPHHTIFFPAGDYLISAPLDIPRGNEYQVNLLLDPNARIFSNSHITALINIGVTQTGSLYERYEVGNNVTIMGGIWDALNATYAIYGTPERKQTRLFNCNIINVTDYGIYIDRHEEASTSNSSDWTILMCTIQGNQNTINTTGIYLYGNDNELVDNRITGCTVGIDIPGGGNLISVTHITATFETPSASLINTTTGVIIRGGINMFSELYIDTCGTCMLFQSNDTTTYIDQMHTYYYQDGDEANYTCFLVDSVHYINISNSTLQLGQNNTQGTKYYLKYTSNGNANSFRAYPTMKKIFQAQQVKIRGGVQNDDDLIRCAQLNDSYDVVVCNPNPWTNNLTQNAWYKIARINSSVHTFQISCQNEVVAVIRLYFNASTFNCSTNVLYDNNSHANGYRIQVGDVATDEWGNIMGTLYFGTTSTQVGSNIVITDISNNFSNIWLDTHNITTPASPTGLVGSPFIINPS